MKRIPVRILASACLLAGLNLRAATVEAALDAAIVPGADFIIAANNAKIKASPICVKLVEALNEIEKRDAESEQPEISLIINKFFKESENIAEKHGLDDANIEREIVTANLLNIYFLVDPCFIDGVSFKTPVSKAALHQYLAECVKLIAGIDPRVAAYMDGHVQVAEFSRGNAEGVEVTIKILNDEDDPVLTFALLAEGKVLLIGLRDTIEGAIQRAEAGQKAALAPRTQKVLDSRCNGVILGQCDFYLACNFAKTYRLMTTLMLNGKHIPDLPPGMLPAFKALTSLKGAGLALNSGETLDVSLHALLGTPEAAAEFKEFLDINAVNLAKMALFQSTGRHLPFAESLGTTTDAGAISFNAKISATDIDFFSGTLLEKLFPKPGAFIIEEDDE